METKKPPARIHVYVASEKPYAMILRQGPSKQFCSIGWDMMTNEFTIGQWLKSKIYTDRCDISPNGKYFIYFVLNGDWDSDIGGTYTAISKTPYLKAIDLWPNNSNTWTGGGGFASNEKVLLDHEDHEDEHFIRSNQFKVKFNCNDNSISTYHHSLKRLGWETLNYDGFHTTQTHKHLEQGWVLVRHRNGSERTLERDGSYHRHELINTNTQQRIDGALWEWADYFRNQLHWSEKGCIYKAKLNKNGLEDIRLIKDFNAMTFEAIKAPY